MNEIKELIKRANEYLGSSKLLLDNNDFDSSVSRAYYAMFFATEALLLTRELNFSSHKGVISAFGQHFVKTGIFSKEMRRQLQNAFNKRQKGDYSFRAITTKEEATVTLIDANDFVGKIHEYLKKEGYEV